MYSEAPANKAADKAAIKLNIRPIGILSFSHATLSPFIYAVPKLTPQSISVH